MGVRGISAKPRQQLYFAGAASTMPAQIARRPPYGAEPYHRVAARLSPAGPLA